MSPSDDSKCLDNGDLQELNEYLKTLYFDVRASLKNGGDVSTLIQQIGEFKQYAEALSELPAELNLVVTRLSPEKIEDSLSKELNGQASGARRQKNGSYDFLLLEAFRRRETFGPIGQNNLLKLALAFDSNTKKPSLVAKLNRWKNDKKWLEWSESEDITMTQNGEAERARLFPLVKRDGDLDAVSDAFSEAWSITANLS